MDKEKGEELISMAIRKLKKRAIVGQKIIASGEAEVVKDRASSPPPPTRWSVSEKSVKEGSINRPWREEKKASRGRTENRKQMES